MGRSQARDRSAAGAVLDLADGSRATIVDRALELRDAEGRLLVRYCDGEAEIAAPTGDLRLSAPAGRVVLESATDVELRAARDVVIQPGRRSRIEHGDTRIDVDEKGLHANAPRLDVNAKKTRIATSEATIIAGRIATSAERLAVEVERYELTAQRIVERSRDTFREVSDLMQQKVGRMRTFVTGLHALYSKRTVMVSKKETSIDGKKILLG